MPQTLFCSPKIWGGTNVFQDPYFMRNHLGSYECRLCLTLHTNEGSYLAHTQGKRHQSNLERRGMVELKGGIWELNHRILTFGDENIIVAFFCPPNSLLGRADISFLPQWDVTLLFVQFIDE
jgi:hypothetical protein